MGRTRRKDTAEAGGTVPPFAIPPVLLGSPGHTLWEPLVLGRRGTNASEWQMETDLPSQGEGRGMWEKGAEWTAVTVRRPTELGVCHMTLVRMRNLTVVPPNSSLLWSPGCDSGHPVYCEVKRTHLRHPGSPGAPSQRGLE